LVSEITGKTLLSTKEMLETGVNEPVWRRMECLDVPKCGTMEGDIGGHTPCER